MPVRPAASAAAEPPDEPPGVRDRSHGLLVDAVDLVVALPVGEVQRHVGLAEQGDAGIDHALRHQRVLLGDVVLEGGIAPGRGQARDVERLLDGHRHAVQRPQLLPRLDRLVGRPGPLARALDVGGDDGVELGIVGFDPLEIEVQKFEAADLLLPDRGGELLGGLERQSKGHGRWVPAAMDDD